MGKHAVLAVFTCYIILLLTSLQSLSLLLTPKSSLLTLADVQHPRIYLQWLRVDPASLVDTWASASRANSISSSAT